MFRRIVWACLIGLCLAAAARGADTKTSYVQFRGDYLAIRDVCPQALPINIRSNIQIAPSSEGDYHAEIAWQTDWTVTADGNSWGDWTGWRIWEYWPYDYLWRITTPSGGKDVYDPDTDTLYRVRWSGSRSPWQSPNVHSTDQTIRFRIDVYPQ